MNPITYLIGDNFNINQELISFEETKNFVIEYINLCKNSLITFYNNFPFDYLEYYNMQITDYNNLMLNIYKTRRDELYIIILMVNMWYIQQYLKLNSINIEYPWTPGSVDASLIINIAHEVITPISGD